jgi:hypothetical protein
MNSAPLYFRELTPVPFSVSVNPGCASMLETAQTTSNGRKEIGAGHNFPERD